MREGQQLIKLINDAKEFKRILIYHDASYNPFKRVYKWFVDGKAGHYKVPHDLALCIAKEVNDYIKRHEHNFSLIGKDVK